MMMKKKKTCLYNSIRYRPLIDLLQEIQDWFHGPQNWENRGIMMTSGAQEGLSKAVDMCIKCGDPVIMPDPVYTGAIDLVSSIFPCYKSTPKLNWFQHFLITRIFLYE